jgi:hypothetical protein
MSKPRPYQGVVTTYADIQLTAARAADEELVRARTTSVPDLATLFLYSFHAFHSAVRLMKLSRERKKPFFGAGGFVSHQAHLTEFMARINAMKVDAFLRRWPRTPGMVFACLAGNSALELAIEFARQVDKAALSWRPNLYETLVESPRTSRELKRWGTDTMRELRERTVPLPMWTMHEIHRDAMSLDLKLKDEFERVIADAEVNGGRPSTNGPEGKRQKTKEPSQKAFAAYRTVRILRKTQLETARELGVRQGQISRWVKQVAEWIEAGNVLPDLPQVPHRRARAVDPEVIDMGEREDHRTRRQREKKSDDDDA